MKAAVRVAPGTIEIQEWSDPEERPDAIGVRIALVGICGGDMLYFQNQGPVHSRPEALVVCHEAMGYTPDGVRVVIDPLVRCGACVACLEDREQLCPDRKDMGYSAHGVARDLVMMSPDRVHAVPDKVSDEAATFAHGLAAILHALDKVDVDSTTEALVLGPGPAGIMFAMRLASLGAQVTLAGRPSSRLSLARSLSIPVLEMGSDGEVPGVSESFDLVVEATGAEAVQAAGLGALRPGGTLLLYAPGEFRLDVNVLFRRELRVVGSTGATGKIPAALDAIASGLSIDALVTHVFPFREIQDAFAQTTLPPARRGDLVKALVAVGV